MQKWVNEYYKGKTQDILQQKYFDIMYERCKEMGVKIAEKSELNFNPEKDWASVKIYQNIIKYKENYDKFPVGVLETFYDFSKKYCSDTSSKLYIDKTKDYPTVQETIDIIRQCNGLAFLPHLFIYKWADDRKKLIDEILENNDVDGIECMHSEFSQEEINYLIKLANERNYLKSGGSDYHGTNKAGIYLGKGKGNLTIPEEFINEWK